MEAAPCNAFRTTFVGSMTQRVFDPVFPFLHLDLGCAARLDHGDTAGKFCEPFLKLFPVIVGCRVLDLRLDLFDPRLDVLFVSGAADDRGVVLIDGDANRAPEHGRRHVLEFDAEVFGNHGSAG